MKLWPTYLLSLITLIASAQQFDNAIARVNYSYTHIRDTNNRANLYQEQMLLVVGKNASIYTSFDKIAYLKERANYIKEQNKINGGPIQNLRLTGSRKPTTGFDIYFFAKEKEFHFVELLMANNYVVKDTATQIDWRITQDTTNFLGIHCRKASANFKGRNWTAWYSTEIPLVSGPWKLNGLPGLIVSAYDEKHEIEFKLEELTQVTPENIDESEEKIPLGTGSMIASYRQYYGGIIQMPQAIKTTKAEMIRLKQAITANPEAVMNSMLAGQGSIKKQSSGTGTTVQKQNTYNNPIELPEKKKLN
ncbi:MAG: GLPGLI family protein [Chitinophagaceae bacterium]|nr:MAG: GLPGLI family protein [Chitinophagaceae bacterium]